MQDEKNRSASADIHPMSRREFTALTLAAGVAAAIPAQSAQAAAAVSSTDVEIRTPNGVCDAAFVHPGSGRWPAVIMFPDVFGLRPTFRDMAKRLAADGYSVLVPNPFYRATRRRASSSASISRTPMTERGSARCARR